jgi:hypothetical protein
VGAQAAAPCVGCIADGSGDYGGRGLRRRFYHITAHTGHTFGNVYRNRHRNVGNSEEPDQPDGGSSVDPLRLLPLGVVRISDDSRRTVDGILGIPATAQLTGNATVFDLAGCGLMSMMIVILTERCEPKYFTGGAKSLAHCLDYPIRAGAFQTIANKAITLRTPVPGILSAIEILRQLRYSCSQD